MESPRGKLKLLYYPHLFFRFIGKAFLALSEMVPYTFAKKIERNGNLLTYKVGDLTWRLNPRNYIDGEIIKNGVFERMSIKFLNKIVKPGMIVVDVGANFGYYTIQLSKLVGSDGKVYAFEPIKYFRERLIDHILLNNCKNVVVEGFGLSNSEKEVDIHISRDTATLHNLNNQLLPGEENARITLITLDDYLEKNNISQVDFVKIDIDGHEPYFLKGAENTLRKYHPALLIEFAQLYLLASGSGSDQLSKILQEFEYTLFSEKTGCPYNSEVEFLIDAMNCAYSTNVFCFYKESIHKSNSNILVS